MRAPTWFQVRCPFLSSQSNTGATSTSTATRRQHSPTQEEVEDTLEGYTGLAQQPVVVH